ncbi:MAG: sodium:solute symporter [Streptosporangiales bacterium]|nr:sodium:solute symporter [Streptosporangiales bacterium]
MLSWWTGGIVLVATLALFVWIGLRTRLAGRDVEDYVVARGSQGSLTLALSFMASGMGAWILFTPPEVGATVGIDGVAGYAIASALPMVAFALLGRRVRRVVPSGHALTEFVRLRYGPGFHGYVVGVSVLYMVIFVTAELTAIGGASAVLADLDARVVIVAVAAATLGYTAYGGLRASLRTDRWQAWFIFALLGVAALAVFWSMDREAARPEAQHLLGVDAGGIEVAVTLVIAVVAANLFHQGYWQRVWAARDLSALYRGAGLAAVMVIPVVAVIGAIGVFAARTGAELGSPPVPFFAVLGGLPGWLSAVAMIFGLSLVTSSVDTLENALASLVVTERRTLSLAWARAVTVLLLIPAIVVAIQGYSVLRIFLIADLLCAATVVPALLGLWSRATVAGALAGSLAGLAGAIVPGWVATGSAARGVLLATFPGGVPTLPPFLGALLASAVITVVVSLFGRTAADVEGLDSRVPALGAAGPRQGG